MTKMTRIKSCKECPWVIRNNNNDSIVNFSKKHNKTHNCHMIKPSVRVGLWDTKDNCQCVGNKQYLETIKNN